ncbi:iron ABC transporter permease [bacterium]|nr:iron ABC transporter permease [bacterium]
MQKHRVASYTGLMLLLLILFILVLALGSVRIPFFEVMSIAINGESTNPVWTNIVLNFRMPKAFTAILAGMALSVSGLQMQTLFRNPLAGPYVLGISSGASLGVAVLVLSAGVLKAVLPIQSPGIQAFSHVIAATIGAGLVMFLIVSIAMRIQSSLTLLIVGIMLGYATSGIVSILMYFGNPDEIQTYIIWTFGSFKGVNWSHLMILAPCVLVGTLYSLGKSKSLNALLLGEIYAKSLGQNIKRVRLGILISISLMAGAVTAFCGPIAFVGIAIPHLSRGLFRSSDHRFLIPATALVGSIVALGSELIATLPGSQFSLPLNAVTSIFGAPIVIWVVLRQHRSLGIS